MAQTLTQYTDSPEICRASSLHHALGGHTHVLSAQSSARRRGSARPSPTFQMSTLRPIRAVSNTGAGAGFKTKFSDSQIVLWPVHCFSILTFRLWSMAGCIFLKWPQHYFHPVFQDPCPNCPSKRWNLFPLPRSLARLWWLPGQTEMQINQPMWLPWLGHRRQHRGSLALLGSWLSEPWCHIVREHRLHRAMCGCSSQQAGAPLPQDSWGNQRAPDPSFQAAQLMPTGPRYSSHTKSLQWRLTLCDPKPAETTDSRMYKCYHFKLQHFGVACYILITGKWSDFNESLQIGKWMNSLSKDIRWWDDEFPWKKVWEEKDKDLVYIPRN